jgi:hypothetical protein
MKKKMLIVVVSLLGLTTVRAQKWSDLTKEEKIMKAQAFRADNQKYLKDSLGLTQTQMDDIDNVNICFLSTLDRIDRYGKDDATKEKYAKAVADARWAQVDAIMGPEKHERYAAYIKAKLKKASQQK